ncbi:MAG: nitroreductase family protein [Microbacterium gubbeenense]|uniref:nitroreductase family protein n=1 Tax=Microbacterium gubbeenense TaxID=159896 RepID=UPI003F9A6517
MYLSIFSDAFRREERAVNRGISAYQHGSAVGRDAYTARRNTHMLEKGLTMRPRRETFGVAYIEETIDVLGRAIGAGVLDSKSAEADWMCAVLDEYFKATAESPSQQIARARAAYGHMRSRWNEIEGINGPHRPTPSATRLDIDDLVELAQGRRSVRWFTADSVSRDVVERALEVGIEAPTACNRQPYRFEIFDDPASVQAVASVPMGTAGYAEQIPGIVVVVGDLSAFFDERDRHLIYIDSCLASMGFILGLESQGVASCCINWPDITERDLQMRDLLNLEDHERVIMLIAYGYADPAGLVPASAKKPIEAARRFRTL